MASSRKKTSRKSCKRSKPASKKRTYKKRSKCVVSSTTNRCRKPKKTGPKTRPRYRKKSKSRKSKKPMADNEFYCLKSKCRRKIPADCICMKKTKNNRYAMRAWCEKSDMYLFKFVKDCDVKRLMSKFGKC